MLSGPSLLSRTVLEPSKLPSHLGGGGISTIKNYTRQNESGIYQDVYDYGKPNINWEGRLPFNQK